MEVIFTYKLSSKTVNVNFLPRKDDEVVMDGETYIVAMVSHDIDDNELEVILKK